MLNQFIKQKSLVLGVLVLASLSVSCGKSASQSKRPRELQLQSTDFITEAGDLESDEKIAKDGKTKVTAFKEAMQAKYPELTTKCNELAHDLAGKYKSWEFTVSHWTMGKSPKIYSREELLKSGASVTDRIAPSDIEVTFEESHSKLISKVSATTPTAKTVSWDVFPNERGHCVFVQDIQQSGRLLNDWIFIEIEPSIDGAGSNRVPFRWIEAKDNYRAYGFVALQR